MLSSLPNKQVASFGVENSKLQEQASELLVEKLQGWI